MFEGATDLTATHIDGLLDHKSITSNAALGASVAPDIARSVALIEPLGSFFNLPNHWRAFFTIERRCPRFGGGFRAAIFVASVHIQVIDRQQLELTYQAASKGNAYHGNQHDFLYQNTASWR